MVGRGKHRLPALGLGAGPRACSPRHNSLGRPPRMCVLFCTGYTGSFQKLERRVLFTHRERRSHSARGSPGRFALLARIGGRERRRAKGTAGGDTGTWLPPIQAVRCEHCLWLKGRGPEAGAETVSLHPLGSLLHWQLPSREDLCPTHSRSEERENSPCILPPAAAAAPSASQGGIWVRSHPSPSF